MQFAMTTKLLMFHFYNPNFFLVNVILIFLVNENSTHAPSRIPHNSMSFTIYLDDPSRLFCRSQHVSISYEKSS